MELPTQRDTILKFIQEISRSSVWRWTKGKMRILFLISWFQIQFNLLLWVSCLWDGLIKKTDIICLSIRLINISDYSAAWYISNMFIDSSSGENPQTVLYTCQNTEVGNKYNWNLMCYGQKCEPREYVIPGVIYIIWCFIFLYYGFALQHWVEYKINTLKQTSYQIDKCFTTPPLNNNYI